MPKELLPLIAYCALMSATPGPNNVMLATSGARFGYRRTLPYLLGISTGVFALSVLVCMGLGALLARHPAVQEGMKVVGALYLVYLAWKIAGASVANPAARERPLTFVEGAIFQGVNPKSWFRAGTLATVFMPAGWEPAAGALLVSGVGMVVGLPCISAWALFGVAIRGFLGTPWRLRVFNATMALSLVALAVSLLL